jgi:hypothetical protein
MGLDHTTLSSTRAVEEFSVSPVTVLAVEQRLIIQLLAHVVEEFSLFPVTVLAVEQGLIIQLSIGHDITEILLKVALNTIMHHIVLPYSGLSLKGVHYLWSMIFTSENLTFCY